ncbi:putative ATP-grasp superfamily ATP-dependent carboligase [Haloactinopolyspora alba]|uniref:Putative ATP-grasp superfamily ATP-dependent carboligase n=1 Tax=Haloactinopolyspora alba TaxID=648780 RepID=A0A2P8E2F7_9ACTN|nr:PAC2 family protein [Haloactinopolyspora alba]PSL03659.1 putative ATP-grasp superfamily ATP-dependent carboligase [Haloactinopolyspora alba]
MSNGSDLYEFVGELPEPESPVLVYWFDGFVDAGKAGKGLIDHLLATLDHEVVARFDVDTLIDYRSRRPEMRFADGAFQEYAAPELTLRRVHDDTGSSFLLLSGPEPDVRWEAFAAAVIDLVERLDVRLSVGVQGIPNPVPHTRPIGVLSHATRPELLDGNGMVDVELRVPGNVSSLLEYRLGKAGKDAIGLVARVPHYLAESDYPQASLSLLRALSSVSGLLLPSDDLVEASRRADELVQEQVEGNEQVAKVVHALESQYDAFAGSESRGSLIAEQQAVPSADEIGAELEQFLAELSDGDDGS